MGDASGTWVLEDGVWVDSNKNQEKGIVISDSVVMGDVIQNLSIDQEELTQAVSAALEKLGFTNNGMHPTQLKRESEVQLRNTITLADTLLQRGVKLDGWTEISLGYACELEGDMKGAKRHFETAKNIAKQRNALDLRLMRHATLGLAVVDMEQGKLNQAEKVVHRLRLEFRQGNDVVGESNAEELLGLIAYSRGNYKQAERFHSASLRMREDAGYEEGVASSKSNLGNVAMSLGDATTAKMLFRDAESDDPSERNRAHLLCNQGVNQLQHGNVQSAIQLIEQSLEIRKQINHRKGITECYNYLGTAYMMQGRFVDGWGVCDKAFRIAEIDGDYATQGLALYHMGQASVSVGNLQRGIQELKSGRGLFRKIGHREGMRNCNSMLRNIGVVDEDAIMKWIAGGLIAFVLLILIF